MILHHHRQFFDRRAQFDQAGQAGAGFAEDGDVLAPFVDLDLEHAADGGGGGAEDAGDVHRLNLFALLGAFGLETPGQARRGLDGGHDDAQHVHRSAQPFAQAGDPGLLQAAQGDGAGGVAGQDHDRGAGLEQPLAPGLGQIDDLLAAAPAVGGVGLVRQIDEVALREPPRQFTMDGQAAHAGVENANSHRRALEQCDDVSNPIGEKIASLSGDARSMCA